MKIPEWNLKETSKLIARWPEYETPAPAKRGEDIKYRVSKVKKYDANGGKFRQSIFEGMGVDRRLVSVLTEAGNRNWARTTWRKHGMAEGHVKRYENEVGKKLNFPFSKTDTLNYVGFLLKRGIRGDTIASYLSSIRAAHIYRGYCCPAQKEDLVTAVINGCKNRDLGVTRDTRLAMTPALMRVFKDRLKLRGWPSMTRGCSGQW